METVKITNLDKMGYTLRESLRELKTNISFCGKGIKSILFTSNSPDEGKSTAVFNLARSLSDSNKRVLIVDTDMRRSVMVGRLGAVLEGGGSIMGLSHYLSGQAHLKDVLYNTSIPGVYMIFAGPEVPNPTELLESNEFGAMIDSAKKNFDYILVDTAPVSATIDATLIGKYVDGAIIVVEQNRTSARDVEYIKRTLDVSGVKILGAILSKVKMEHKRYGKYYGRYYGKYYGNKYYGHYYGRDEENAKQDGDE